MERVIAVVGDREWYITTGDDMDWKVTIVSIDGKLAQRMKTRASEHVSEYFWFFFKQYDVFQGDTMTLAETAQALENQGHKSSSRELYWLNGPRMI